MVSKRQLKAARHRGRPEPSAPAVPEQDEPAEAVAVAKERRCTAAILSRGAAPADCQP